MYGSQSIISPEIPPTPTPGPTLSPIPTSALKTPDVPTSVQAETIETQLDENTHVPMENNMSIALEVDYREYVDWFRNYNLNIRMYTASEYVCGQYTVDMIYASEKAGYKAYFAAVSFGDGSGHAMVSFKSTVAGIGTSWYFFEPQTNKLMTPETIDQILNKNMGKKIKEINIYGYFDDAEDTDPTSWRFMFPLYNRKY